MTAVYALYPDPESADQAVRGLRSAGVTADAVVVVSSEPFEQFEFSRRDRATWMFWIAGAGGVVGLSIGTFLTWYTETAWPLPTGGMPIVAWWPNLIVMFELTMLGGILAAVTTLVVTARLGRRMQALYDPEITNGQILVGVDPPDAAPSEVVQRALASVGNGRIKTLG